MVRHYWGGTDGDQGIGGTLIEEFVMSRQTLSAAIRRADGLILLDGERRIARPSERLSPEGRDVIVIQAKAHPLGMYLLGQAVFSLALIRRFRPRSAKSVALCTKDDSSLRPLLADFPDVEVVVMPQFQRLRGRRGIRVKLTTPTAT
jgi:hypothetical protein